MSNVIKIHEKMSRLLKYIAYGEELEAEIRILQERTE